MVDYLSGGRIQGSSTLTSAPPATSWKELDRVTLGSAGDTLDTGTFTAKDNIMVLCSVRNDGSSNLCDPHIRFNNDSGSNYAFRYSLDGGTDSTSTSSSSIDLGAGGNYRGEQFVVCDTVNISAQEKLINASGAFNDQYSVTAGLAPDRSEVVGKWANTSAQINRVELVNTSTGDFASGSELVVLGFDNDEADSGTNFWQELGTTTASGGEDKLSVTVDKKYLMFEMYKIQDGSCSADLQFNGDTGSNYAWRISSDGASDVASSSGQVRIVVDRGQVASNPSKVSGFIINVSGQEKLVISEANAQNTAGASTAPQRRELVGKWANTSSAITSVDMINPESGSFAAGSYLKVWGAD